MSASILPLVSIILPVHNSEQYLRSAIQSILDQTYKNFELLILISATTNQESLDIINSFSDKRIKLIQRGQGENLPRALNRGIEEAKGEYIARMDADDISMPRRLKEQVHFMNTHSYIGVSGSWYKTIGVKRPYVNKGLTDPEDIRANFLFNTSIAHPSVMLRKSFFEKFRLRYNSSLSHGEDYDLWTRCSAYFPIANVNKVLFLYRIHEKSASHVYEKETKDTASRVKLYLLQKLGLEPTIEEMRIHNSLYPQEKESIGDFIKKEEDWLNKIVKANQQTSIYKNESLKKIIYMRWRIICGMNAKGGLMVWKKFVQSPLFKIKKQNRIWDSAKLLIKCLLKKAIIFFALSSQVQSTTLS